MDKNKKILTYKHKETINSLEKIHFNSEYIDRITVAIKNYWDKENANIYFSAQVTIMYFFPMKEIIYVPMAYGNGSALNELIMKMFGYYAPKSIDSVPYLEMLTYKDTTTENVCNNFGMVKPLTKAEEKGNDFWNKHYFYLTERYKKKDYKDFVLFNFVSGINAYIEERKNREDIRAFCKYFFTDGNVFNVSQEPYNFFGKDIFMYVLPIKK